MMPALVSGTDTLQITQGIWAADSARLRISTLLALNLDATLSRYGAYPAASRPYSP